MCLSNAYPMGQSRTRSEQAGAQILFNSLLKSPEEADWCILNTGTETAWKVLQDGMQSWFSAILRPATLWWIEKVRGSHQETRPRETCSPTLSFLLTCFLSAPSLFCGSCFTEAQLIWYDSLFKQ